MPNSLQFSMKLSLNEREPHLARNINNFPIYSFKGKASLVKLNLPLRAQRMYHDFNDFNRTFWLSKKKQIFSCVKFKMQVFFFILKVFLSLGIHKLLEIWEIGLNVLWNWSHLTALPDCELQSRWGYYLLGFAPCYK